VSHHPGSLSGSGRVARVRRATAAALTAAMLASMVVGARPAAATSHLTISVADSSVVEGDSGTVQLSFTVSIDQEEAPVQDDIEFEWETEDGTAVAAGDYTAVTAGVGTIQSILSNPPNGEMETTITVDVSGDPDVEPDETFTVRLTAVTAGDAAINGDEATGTITDDDDLPVIWVDDASVEEGDEGDETPMAFTVRLSQASADPITLAYKTADGTDDVSGPVLEAEDGSSSFEDHDYQPAPPESTTSTPPVPAAQFVVPAWATAVDVPVTTTVGDGKHELDEVFTVELYTPSGVTNPDFRMPYASDPNRSSKAVGTILNDDPLPTVRIADRTFLELASGAVVQRNVELTLSHLSSQDVTVRYTTRDGTATVDDGDYAATDQTVALPGQPRVQEVDATTLVQIETYGDDEPEPNEAFFVDLSFEDVPEPVNGQLADDGSATATITMLNDDGPRLTIDDVEVDEGETGTTDAELTVTVVEPGDDAISLDWTTVDGSAVGGTDYQAASGTLEIAAGETTGTITVKVIGDTTDEPDRAFRVQLSDPVGATLLEDVGEVTIRDDDAGRPTAVIAAPASGAVEGSSVALDGSDSADPDGEIVSYSWDLGDGSEPVTSASPTVAHTFADDGTYTVKLTVTDDDDLAASTSRKVTVANAAPTVEAGPDATVKVRRSVTLQASASDPGDDELTYSWDLGDGSEPVTGSEVTHTYTDAGQHTVTVTVSDGDGGTDSDTLVVDVTPDVGAVDRLSGDNRIATSLEVSRAGWPSPDDGALASRDVVLATAWNYPDALAGGTLAALLKAPILLTDAGQLPAAVGTEIDRLGSTRVWILGGEAAVSDTVARAAAADGRQVFRLEGSDRFETAAAVARATGPSRAGEVVIALGAHEVPDRAWPDAVSAGALGSAPDPPPVLLTLPDALPGATEQALADVEARTVYLLGGTGAITSGVEERLTELGYEVERLAGPDRYATSLAVAELALSRHDADSEPSLVFATGTAFPDGLTATALAARMGALVLLVPRDEVSGETTAFLADDADLFDLGVVVGGTAVVSDAVRDQLQAAITRR